MTNNVRLAILVSALGYFVDVYDLILFSILRVPSLTDLGISGDELVTVGGYLLNMQMGGFLVGGVLWGVIGDKVGRIELLFGSILLYSVGNILNGFVGQFGPGVDAVMSPIDQYAVLRFITGVGLAGEIGGGITLVSELLPKNTRGYGTTIVVATGVAGAVVAALVYEYFSWRSAYIVGGVLGLGLLGVAHVGRGVRASSRRWRAKSMFRAAISSCCSPRGIASGAMRTPSWSDCRSGIRWPSW